MAAVDLTVISATIATLAMSATLGWPVDLGMCVVIYKTAAAIDSGLLPSQPRVRPSGRLQQRQKKRHKLRQPMRRDSTATTRREINNHA